MNRSEYNPEIHHRQSIRLKGHDYAGGGLYFVTINAHESRALFGVIVNGHMVLNEAGRIADEEWRRSAVIRKGIELDEFVIMPTHMHGIVRLKGFDAQEGFDASNPYTPKFGKPIAGALGTFVGAYKAAVTREINRRGLMHQTRAPISAGASAIWHRNYWDIIVHDKKALANIRNYIRFNPQNYDVVMQAGEPQSVGNLNLLEMPKIGFMASQGADKLHGHLQVKPGEAIMSGFLSPLERAIFKAGLEHQRPLIWVKPWGLEPREDLGLTRQTRTAIDEGRLLILSPFADSIEAPSVRRAAWCNQYVLAHCDRMVIGHLNPGGMLACVLSEANPELEIFYL